MTAQPPTPSDAQPSNQISAPAELAPRSRGAVLGATAALALTGVIGAVLAFLAINAIGEVFRLPAELAALGVGKIPSSEEQQRLAAGNQTLQYKRSVLWLGSAGAILGGLFGLTLGMFRSSRIATFRGLAGGVLLGGVFGACAGPLAMFLDLRLHQNLPPGQLTVPEHWVILMHAATWLIIGLGVGLGAGWGTPLKRGRTMAASMIVAGIAGALGGALYLFLAGFAMPLADATLPIPDENWNRLLWLGLPSILIGLALGRKG